MDRYTYRQRDRQTDRQKERQKKGFGRVSLYQCDIIMFRFKLNPSITLILPLLNQQKLQREHTACNMYVPQVELSFKANTIVPDYLCSATRNFCLGTYTVYNYYRHRQHLSRFICGQCSSRSACASTQSELRVTVSSAQSMYLYFKDYRTVQLSDKPARMRMLIWR